MPIPGAYFLQNLFLDLLVRSRAKPVATVAFTMRPVPGPWGGSSVFVKQFARYLRRQGYRVCFRMDESVDVVVLVDPRSDLQYKSIDVSEIREFRQRFGRVKVLHRVNECDLRKGTDFMDRLLAEANPLADYTVFISEWLRDHHASRWFDSNRPHGVVYNGADPRFFHPVGGAVLRGNEPFRIVSHHWAGSRIKGFDVYEKLDQMIADGKVRDAKLVIIGRWPEDIRWKTAELHPPTHGADLGNQLRRCHAYITASQWEPCGMHHVEGAQCGLPLMYHEDGGGIVEAGRKYGVGFRDDVAAAIETLRKDYPAYRERVLRLAPSGDLMCAQYAAVVRQLAAAACAEREQRDGRRS